jgi:hypothetical protein
MPEDRTPPIAPDEKNSDSEKTIDIRGKLPNQYEDAARRKKPEKSEPLEHEPGGCGDDQNDCGL